MGIKENIEEVKRNIALAAEKAGRAPEDICLVGATKMNDAARVREAIAAGLAICGENRVQELREKNGQGAYEGAKLHFIGRLQKNKVKYVVGTAELIHSVDSVELMDEIHRKALDKGLIQDILLEINVAGEESKSGFRPEDCASAIAHAAALSGIRVRGLMTIPPVCESGEENRPYFEMIRKLFIDNGEKKYDNIFMEFMSLGMSGDYRTAIDCGANMIRIGTAIFGQRITRQR